MKHKKLITSLILILLIIIIAICLISFFNKNKQQNTQQNTQQFTQMQNSENQNKEEGGMQKNKIQKEQTTTLSSNSEVKSALTENIELHTTYYLSEVYVEENQFIEKDGNILKYTNGTYLTAPYDCYITELNIPETKGQCLNSHYIQVESKNILSVSMQVDETQISKVNIGKEATIEVTAIDKKYTGYVTNIGSIASNGKFEITIEFENDGNTMVGMTSKVEMTI